MESLVLLRQNAAWADMSGFCLNCICWLLALFFLIKIPKFRVRYN